MFGDIVAGCDGFNHNMFLQVLREPHGGLDIFRLGAFVTASQQDYHFLSSLYKIHPITGAVIDPQFRNAFTDWPDIPWISGRQPFYSYKNTCARLYVAQTIKPLGEGLRFTDFDHDRSVALRLHLVNVCFRMIYEGPTSKLSGGEAVR